MKAKKRRCLWGDASAHSFAWMCTFECRWWEMMISLHIFVQIHIYTYIHIYLYKYHISMKWVRAKNVKDLGWIQRRRNKVNIPDIDWWWQRVKRRGGVRRRRRRPLKILKRQLITNFNFSKFIKWSKRSVGTVPGRRKGMEWNSPYVVLWCCLEPSTASHRHKKLTSLSLRKEWDLPSNLSFFLSLWNCSRGSVLSSLWSVSLITEGRLFEDDPEGVMMPCEEEEVVDACLRSQK